MKTTVLFCGFLLILTATRAQTYSPTDEGSKVKFVIKNFGINTGGTFEGLQGSIAFDPSNPTSARFDVSVDASTIDTDISSRDNHLRKSEYFDVKTHPRIHFKSVRVSRSNNAEYLYMVGTITIKGITKEVSFPFKAIPDNGGFRFEGDFKLNRRDFGVGGKSMSLGDEVVIDLKIYAKKN